MRRVAGNGDVAETVAGNIDILSEILLRVPAKPLLKFKCVSKQWLTLISDPQFSSPPHSSPPQSSRRPQRPSPQQQLQALSSLPSRASPNFQLCFTCCSCSLFRLPQCSSRYHSSIMQWATSLFLWLPRDR
ncbi:hypothetical protein K1719_030322 [Acacia pycnantha]|nr:hypothetical protein K1719_030322 [Acacia pycnantha]